MIKTLFCDKWEFSKSPIDTDYENASDFSSVDLPHDWLIFDTSNLYETSTGWYRKKYFHKNDGLRTSLYFDGVYNECTVFVNGISAGEHKNGYTSFEFDITDLLIDGDNLITVCVDHRAPNSRWYSGAGIYRNVYLCRYPEEHILCGGLYISADDSGKAAVTVEAARPENETTDGLSIHTMICRNGMIAAEKEFPCIAADRSVFSQELLTDGFRYSSNEFVFAIDSPELWDIDSPNLYICTAELKKNGEVIDTLSEKFGFRRAEFTPDKGFFLNGRHIKLHGCCEHHDLGALGAAFNIHAMRRKLEKLRTMGVNALRTTHNPPAPEVMSLADEMGFLVLSEFTDVWEKPKTENDYARFFKDHCSEDILSWIRRDRNHPCVIGWSLGNEIYDTAADERGQEIISMMKMLVQKHDPRGNACITIGSNHMRTENGVKCADILKTVGYNYSEELYERHHREHPEWCIYGSETSSVVQSRGIYHFPLGQAILSDDDEQCSSLGNGSPIWAAKSWEACILPDRDLEFCAGQFIWTGFDYIGEPTPYDTKNSYFGQFDTAGFEKDSAYVFRSAWTEHKKAPFVHIFPYWNFNAGEIIDVRVASNAPVIKLYLNGNLIKEQSFDRLHGKKLLLDAKIPFEKGELRAEALDENGNIIAEDIRRTFGNATVIKAVPDKTTLKADGTDMIFVDISAYDKDGVFTANANNRVFVDVSGAGRLVGLDNGDSTDYDSYKGISRRMFSGKLLAMIAAKTAAGDITVKITSPGLPETVLSLKAEEAEVPAGVSCNYENSDCGEDMSGDISVRMIVLGSERKVFDPDHKNIRINTKVFPENAVYKKDIEYCLSAVNGADSKLAEITAQDENGVSVACFGDGEFQLRAYCRNGTDKRHIMSVINLRGDGLGKAFTDPYEFVSGGTYSVSSGDVSNGLEYGIRFGENGGYAVFENVDFGDTGSDRITLPIFADRDTPVNIKIYDGIPGDGGKLIGSFDYCKERIWLVYQDETFTLEKPLCGVHTVTFASDEKYDLKGFVFEKRARETAEIFAVNNEGIYGDKFAVEEDAVTGIGNNVTLNFGEFRFGDVRSHRIFITGRTPLPKNSITLVISGDHDKQNICDFEKSAEYTERVFDIGEFGGNVRVSFIFLPGCDFDFRSFRFE